MRSLKKLCYTRRLISAAAVRYDQGGGCASSALCMCAATPVTLIPQESHGLLHSTGALYFITVKKKETLALIQLEFRLN